MPVDYQPDLGGDVQASRSGWQPHSFLGTQTAAYSSVGNFSALRVNDPQVQAGTSHSAHQRILAKNSSSTAWVSVGWMEFAPWGDRQYLVTSVNGQITRYDSYQLNPGDILYVREFHIGGGVWTTEVFWNGAWNTLADYNMGSEDIGAGNENMLEIDIPTQTPGAPAGELFPFGPDQDIQWGTPGEPMSSSLASAATATWESWSVQSFLNSSAENGYYTTTFYGNYYAGFYSSHNHAPNISSAGVSPPHTAVAANVSAGVNAGDAEGDEFGVVIDWGDGSVSQGANASHAYMAPGHYTVMFTLTDKWGAESSTTREVHVCPVDAGTCQQQPDPNPKVPGACLPQDRTCESSVFEPLELAQQILASVGLEPTDRQLAQAVAQAQTTSGVRGPMGDVLTQVDEVLTQTDNIFTDDLNGMTDKGQDEVVYSVAKVVYEKGNYGITAEEIAICLSSGKFAAFCAQGVGIRAEAWESSRYWYSTWPSQDSPQDAYRHCFWSALLAKRTSYRFTELITTAHEPKPRSPAGQMDLHNNFHGRNAGRAGALNHEHRGALERRCIDLGENGILIRSLNDYRIDK